MTITHKREVFRRCGHIEAGSGERCELHTGHIGWHEGFGMTWPDVATDNKGTPVYGPDAFVAFIGGGENSRGKFPTNLSELNDDLKEFERRFGATSFTPSPTPQ